MTHEELANNVRKRFAAHFDKDPQIDSSAFIAESAEIIGDVRLAKNVSIWPKCVLRGDINYIEVGEGSNIQDGTIVHLADDFPVVIGKYVTIGHAAMIHACTIEDECLIGMRATILDGAVIGHNSIVGAGAVVTPGTIIPPNSMVLGIPAKVVKELDPDTSLSLRYWADKYVEGAKYHKEAKT